MKILIGVLSVCLLLLIGALYGGIGWAVAWILDKGLDVNINYEIFVIVGLVIYLIKVIPISIFGMLALREKKKLDEFEKDWKQP